MLKFAVPRVHTQNFRLLMDPLSHLFQKQEETSKVIDGYIHFQEVNIPRDIHTEIQKKFVEYYWNATNIFDCTQNEFRDIVKLCIEPIENRSSHKVSFDKIKLFDLLQKMEMNGNQYCAMKEREWCMLLKYQQICSIGKAKMIWQRLMSFKFERVEQKRPIYLALKQSQ